MTQSHPWEDLGYWSSAAGQLERGELIRARHDDVDAVRRACLRRFKAGEDVGAFLIDALVEAEAAVDKREPGRLLTDNRPGSWEADLLAQMLQGGGSEVRRG